MTITQPLPGPAPARWSSKFKRWLTQSPLRYSARIDELNRLDRLNDWRARHAETVPYFQHRDSLYSHLMAGIGDREIVYLEFGVWQGASMWYWSRGHRHPDSQLWGFDTFTGLPEDWLTYHGTVGAGSYSAGGNVPSFADPRVHFVRGLFQDTLPTWLAEHDLTDKQLVINNDSDLYSATLFTLCTLDPVVRRGTIVIFDEFSHVLDEFRALEDYTSAFRRSYRAVGASGQYYDRVAIQLT